MASVVLGQAGRPIEYAVRRMLKKPKVTRPFVVVQEDDQSGFSRAYVSTRFVQFCEYSGLLFDVPALGIQEEVSIDDAAERAIRCLKDQGLGDADLVTITEGESGGKRIVEPFGSAGARDMAQG